MQLRGGPGALDLDSLDRHLSAGDPPLVDLAPTTFVDAYGLVATACLMQAQAGTEPRTVFTAPENVNVRNYLARMRLQEVLDRWGVRVEGTPLGRVREHAGSDQLLPLQWFDESADYARLADLVWSRLDGQVDPHVLAALYEALHELAANVVEHSRAPGG